MNEIDKKIQELIQIIASDGIPWKVVLDAIVDALELLNDDHTNNVEKAKEIASMISVYGQSTASDNSSAEVALARGDEADLNARLQSIEGLIGKLQDEFELQKPYRETKTRKETINFSKATQTDSDLYSKDSYIKTTGVDGYRTIQYEEEFINGIPTKRIFNEKILEEISPINEVFIQGTKEIKKDPIRYIKFNANKADTNVSRYIELVVKASGGNLVNSDNLFIRDDNKNVDARVLFDGNIGYSHDAVISQDNDPFIVLDLGRGRTDLTEVSMYPYPHTKHRYIAIQTSSDGQNWKWIFRKNDWTSDKAGEGINIIGDDIWLNNLGNYYQNKKLKKVSKGSFEAEIGDEVIINNPNITLYHDSDRAFAKNKVGAGSWNNIKYKSNKAKVMDKITRSGVSVYAVYSYYPNLGRWVGEGWIRGEDNNPR